MDKTLPDSELNRLPFLKCMTWIMALILTVQSLRGSTSEAIDQGIFLGSIFLGFTTLFLQKTKKSSKIRNLLAINIVFVVVYIIGIFGIEKHPTMDPNFLHDLWLGFGLYVLAICFILLPLIWTLYFRNSENKLIHLLLTLIAGVISVLAFPALIQGGNSIIDTYHSEYVINELLAVPAGNIPYVDFIPQYGILYSWLIAPFSHALQPNQLVTLGLYLMSAGGIIAVALGVWLTYKAMNKRSLPLAILLVVPFTLISKFPGRDDFPSTINALLSAVPVRLLPGMAIATLMLAEIFGRKQSWRIYVLGALSGLCFWLNQDFALAASGVVGLYALLYLDSKIKIRFFATYVLGALSYPLFLSVFGHEFRWDSIGFFVVQYTGGFMAEPIQTPGPVLIILPLIVSLFFASSYPLYQERFKKRLIPSELRRAVMTSNFFALWSLIGFAYYLNRSYASGQMQILFLPLSVSLASYLYYLTSHNNENLPWTPKSFFQASRWRGRQLQTRLTYLPIALIMALPLATIIAFPNPSIEIDRLTNAPETNRWPLPKNKVAFSDISSFKDNYNLKDLAYFGSSGNYAELEFGINSGNVFNSPFDLFMSQNMIDRGCSALNATGAKYVVLNDTGLLIAQNFVNQKLCGRYIFDPTLPKRMMKLE